MKVYINERSIVGQAADDNEAMNILLDLAMLVANSRELACERKAYRTLDLGDKLITSERSIKQLLIDSSNKARALDERQRKIVIEVLLKRPYSERVHGDAEDYIHCAAGECLKNSCFDDAASSVGSPLTFSAKKCPPYEVPSLTVTSSKWGKKKVMNVFDDVGLSNITWIFEHNPKHKNKVYTNAGEVVSIMDLSGDEAQRALSNGIKVGARVYSYHNESWYQFHCHQNNNFHGFKVKLADNNPEHQKAVSIFSSLGHKPYGQVFS